MLNHTLTAEDAEDAEENKKQITTEDTELHREGLFSVPLWCAK